MTILDIFRKKKNDKHEQVFDILWDRSREKLRPDDFASLVKAYQSWVYIAANRNAVTLASIPLRLYIAKKTSGKQTKQISRERKESFYRRESLQYILRKAMDIEEVVEHPFLEMMNNVNPHMNSFMLQETTAAFQETTGNAYWFIAANPLGIPSQIWILPSQNMTIKPSKKDFIGGYVYTKSDGEKIPFDENEIIHFKYPSLKSVYYGMAPLMAIATAVNINYNMGEYEKALFGNDGRLMGAFETDHEIGDEEFKRLKKELKKSISGISNTGKIPLLDQGLHYKPYASSPRELSFIIGRKLTKEEIFNAFGQTMGMYEKEANRANAEAAIYLYMKNTIKPRLIRQEQKLNEKLIPRYNENLFLAYDECVPEDKEFRLKEKESNLKIGYSSINEERQIDGRDTVEWGDRPILPFNVAPFGSGGSGIQSSEGKVIKIGNMKNNREEKWNEYIKRVTPFESKFQDMLKGLFGKQEAEVIANIKKTPKAMKAEKGIVESWLFGMESWNGKFTNAGAPIIGDVLTANARAAISDLPFEFTFNPVDPRVTNYVNQRSVLYSQKINNTTYESLRTELIEGLSGKETVTQMVDRVHSVYDKAKGYRTDMIARTEVIGSSNYGALEGWWQTGKVQGKEWLATPDAATRDSHVAMDGEVQPVYSMFSNGLMYPGDFNGDLAEIANCRCTIIPRIEGE